MSDSNENNVARSVVEGRKKRYGNSSFGHRAAISQKIKEALRESPFWAALLHEEREALDMMAHKMARIAGGEVERLDSWVDVAGYAELVIMERGDSWE